MVQQARFTGLMDLDSRDDLIMPGWHKYALNGRFFGTQQGLTFQNAPGNVLIPNSSLPSSGVNECIGGFFDPMKKRVIYFNYNSGGLNGIYSYSFSDGTITKIFLCFTDSASDILGFSLDYPVHSAAIVYRTASDGDLLYWTDEFNRPRYLNIDTVSTVGQFTEDMINAAKNAPLIPPSVLYRDDTSVTVNNLRKQLFQFCYRWQYNNLENSTISPFSKLGLPVGYSNVDTQNDPTKNNNIRITFQTGNNDFSGVELLGRVSLGAEYGDWFSIVTLDRTDYSYNPLTNYTFDFYNDGVYSSLLQGVYVNNDPTKGELFFSYLPDKANTLETLNGNVIVYGGITDGYPKIARSDVDVNIIAGIGNPNIPTISWTQAASNQLIIYIGSTITTGATYHIDFLYDAPAPNTAKTINYVTLITDTQSTVATAIAALLTGGGLTATNVGSGVIELSNANGGIYTVHMRMSTAGANTSAPTWDWACAERLGKIYFDDRSKTNGVISFVTNDVDTTDFAVTTPAFTTVNNVPQVPYIAASLNDTPPTWATSYQWVRAALTPKLLYWISNDYQTDTDYLYICIQNLIYTQSKISGYVSSYEFENGDRIKICASYNSGTGFYTPYSVQLDMEVVGVEDRVMTSPASTGSFIKVAKPSTFPSAAYQANMLIKLYTPYLRQTDKQQIFYEWGERYAIYTSGGNRYHRGQITDQTATQPATFQWFDGDVYFKNREFYLDVNATTTTSAFMIDQNYSDYFSSAVNSNGRGWAIDPSAATIYRSNQYRWGQSYIQDTNINQLNIFFPNDFDTIDLAKGAIRRFKQRDRILRIFQEQGCGQVGVYAKFIQDSGDTKLLETSDTIITTNNIQYYIGEYGVGTQPCGLVSGKIQDYFADPVRGYQCRLSDDGIIPISELYKGQFYIRNLILPYNKTYLRTGGGNAKILGTYNYLDEEYVCVLQAGNPSAILRTVANQTITDGDINTPVTSFVAFSGQISSNTYIISFNGTPFTGAVINVTLQIDGANQIYRPLVIQAGWTYATVITQLAALISGDAAYSATTTTYLGNPAVSVQKFGGGSASLTGETTITYPTYIVTFTGTPQTGDKVDLTAYFTSVSPHSYSYTFGAGNTIANMISSLVSSINGGGIFTAVAVTYNGNLGFTVRYIPSYNIFGSTTITLASPVGSLTGNTFSFNERRNGYSSFFDYHPEWITNCEDFIVTFLNGNLYTHNSDTYCNFYGVQYDVSIQLPFNQDLIDKKFWLSLTEIGNRVWACPLIYTSSKSYTNQRQESELIEQDFQEYEGQFNASILRDSKSIGALINGDFMKGSISVITFEVESASDLAYLNEISVLSSYSPLTSKV